MGSLAWPWLGRRLHKPAVLDRAADSLDCPSEADASLVIVVPKAVEAAESAVVTEAGVDSADPGGRDGIPLRDTVGGIK